MVEEIFDSGDAAIEPTDLPLEDALESILRKGLSSEGTVKVIRKATDEIINTIESQILWTLKDEMASQLSGWVVDMFNQAVEQLLLGNEDQMRRYLSCEKRRETGEYAVWTGRSDGYYGARWKEAHEWHPVIHGAVFKHGAMALRKALVEAHRDLLVNERILDLEDQVKSLVAQVNKKTNENEMLYDRLRGA